MNPSDFLFLGFIELAGGGLASVLYLVINIVASIRVVQETRGSAIPLWLLFIWLIPCIGGIVALVSVKKTTPGY